MWLGPNKLVFNAAIALRRSTEIGSLARYSVAVLFTAGVVFGITASPASPPVSLGVHSYADDAQVLYVGVPLGELGTLHWQLRQPVSQLSAGPTRRLSCTLSDGRSLTDARKRHVR